MFYLYKWNNLKADSPSEQTRNEWLYKYGAFGKFNGLWFPCKVQRYSPIGEPATVLCRPLPGALDISIYPQGEVSTLNMEVLYSVFNNGLSIEQYIQKALGRKRITDRMLDAAIRRSLNTEILHAPKRLMRDVKKAANREDKSETFVVPVNVKDEIGSIALPRTVDIIEKLWNSNDWALQEISQQLGISYNPAHGKKERMLENELLGDRDLTIMNREMITSRLVTAAEEFGEKVVHISTEIDNVDRNLPYSQSKEKEVEK